MLDPIRVSPPGRRTDRKPIIPSANGAGFPAVPAGYNTPTQPDAPGSVEFTTAGTFAFVMPVGYDRVYAECWGAGGAGGSSNAGIGCGAGGGAYAAGVVSAESGSSVPVVVGSGGIPSTGNPAGLGGPGLPSSVGTTQVVARGGNGGSQTPTPPTGGQASTSTGTVKYSGGNGGIRFESFGGGGGSSAGPAAAGNAGDINGVPGIAPTGGGNGGAGADGQGLPGQAPGGGGGGSGSNSTFLGGVGAAGRVRITWPVPEGM